MIKPCGLVVLCCVSLPVRARNLVSHRIRRSPALLFALCSLPRLSSRLCCYRRYLNLACLHASPRPQHLSYCLLALTSLGSLTQLHVAFVIATATICMVNCLF
jgi:hypothetical protein